ncbi:MAG: hypothetical protein PVG85_05775 [Deltaproteobacteria bacterium]
MGIKERLAERVERLARLVPGIGSYQDKESRRDADKRLRVTLADRLDSARKTVEEVIAKLQTESHFDQLDRLGRLERKLYQAADSIRFASYGYSGVFDAIKLDEAKLDQLYAFDIALAESVSAIQEAAKNLRASPPEAMRTDVIEPLAQEIASFNGRLQERTALFRE